MRIKDINFAPFVILGINFFLWVCLITVAYSGISLYRDFFGSATGIAYVFRGEKMALLTEERYVFVSGNSQALAVEFAASPIIYHPRTASLLTIEPEDRFGWQNGRFVLARAALLGEITAVSTLIGWDVDNVDICTTAASTGQFTQEDFTRHS